MFTAASRKRALDELLNRARADPLISAAAVVGSGAHETSLDDWSDIDLALRLAPQVDLAAVVHAWTVILYTEFQAVADLDVRRGEALYRVFLLDSTLQVDLSFWPDESFAAHGPNFRLIFGTANRPVPPPDPDPATVTGYAWLYALHVRSSLARSRYWQALYMLNAMREEVVKLACIRHGLPLRDGRGVDQLPPLVRQGLGETLPADLTEAGLSRAFGQLTNLLLAEAEQTDNEVANRLRAPLNELVQTTVSQQPRNP